MENRRNENREICKGIALDLEKVIEGKCYTCPECGETIEIEDFSDFEGKEIVKLPCGCEIEAEQVDYIEQVDLYNYFSDCFDVEVTKGLGEDEVRYCRILVAFGGPNIWVDTGDKAVNLYWWTENASYPLDTEVCDAINEMISEWESCR